MAFDPTVAGVAVGLVGGFGAFRATGRRELGGVVVTSAGAYCTREWLRRGPAVAGGLLGSYISAFTISHPLAKKIGAWPAVFAATTAAAAVTVAVTSAVPAKS
ncbi:hypothetical protein EF294_07235 [Gordonia oryzae]|uniref:Uncharacterized protein n=1 Tax=Gordonia oryzae TaxID=2487349 RepID=A0A3N4GRT4_9ACTN|nr:hypothetical protein [Gordonia oryzae]RPA64955.1 hypothetical protein EF294_07235 [Gordonia oryzae]